MTWVGHSITGLEKDKENQAKAAQGMAALLLNS